MNDQRPGYFASWASLAALAPLYIFSTDLTIGLVLGMTFLVVHSAAASIALLLPVSFGRDRIFVLSVVGAAIAASLCASTIRLLDPFLFEMTSHRLFLTAFTIPVMRAGLIPDTISDRERAWENVVRGLGSAASVVVVGAFRELIASGAVSMTMGQTQTTFLPIAGQPAGGLILLGLAAAVFKALLNAARGTTR
ncbi:MAG: hypothetical protein CVV51_09630 [Spirochaetae bacterium HGW-Spirochaetae-7]|jgi:Na+-translocating ferredoxin:NAD+ oxidoreductase RnfE subunit|nr:MAG: hypothetical protein CVV51_09630 [Spirochaetae bacterium HGW-Spirochaetae-7]